MERMLFERKVFWKLQFSSPLCEFAHSLLVNLYNILVALVQSTGKIKIKERRASVFAF